MELNRLVVATITRARDAGEERLVARTLSGLAALGLPIVASDGGSSEAFIRELSQIPGLSLAPSEHPGMTGQVKAAVRLARACGRPWVLYLESDKELFVRHWLRDFVTSAAHADEADVILASRSHDAFETFPPFQRRTESAFNGVTSEVIGVEADYLYGPFLMRQLAAVQVDAVAPELGWGWRPFLFALAGRRAGGLRIVNGDYVCPPEQRHEDDGERLHRLRQFAQNVDGLTRAAQQNPAP
jgi:hypothetical protein